ncbi:MAG: CapA family protein [Candidatus Cloacimonetes bacterium]|nr:CapA family protein [Candidatus Cloacimonadota bacterium]
MKLKLIFIFIILLLINTLSFAANREVPIEDFESGTIFLTSYPDQDMHPNAWELSTENTYNTLSQYSLKLYGNTWKVEAIEPVTLEDNDIWQVACFIEDKGEIQGFGVSDGTNELFYSLDGTELLNIEEWIPVYQGAFGEGEWNIFQLPIADDWFSWYEYLPEIIELIFINDNDAGSGIVYFDNIYNITEDLPVSPEVEISFEIGDLYRNSNNLRSVNVQFYSEVIDPDSDEHTFLWLFGDDSTSTLQNPAHTYIVEDDHSYSVHLQVTDESDHHGYASCQIDVDEGPTSFPLTMNFVGDIMLARGYEAGGGIIPTQGVEAIFEPTLSIFGENADISVANLECPLTTHNVPHPTKTIYFKGAPENAAGLAFAGIDLVCLANNHVSDYNLEGMQETQSTLDQYGILHSGAGADSYEAYKPLFYSKKGVNLAFLRSCDRTGQYNNYQPYLQAGFNKFGFAYMTPYYIMEQINAVQDNADLIIVEAHSGSEYSTAPGANYDFIDVFAGWDEKDFAEDEDYTPRIDIPHMWDIEIRHHMIDSGADLVICHHPHIIQGLEVYNGKLIAHSLGNFAFDLNYFETFPSMVLNTSIGEDGFSAFSIKPVFIDDYIPQIAIGELGNYILDYLKMRSKELNTYLSVDNVEIEAHVILDTLNMLMENEQFTEALTFSFNGDEYISQIIHLPQWGNISSIDAISPGNNYEFRVGRELIWFGNYEDEGASIWNVNSGNEWLDDSEFYEGELSLCIQQNSANGYNIITNMENRMKRRSVGEYSVHGYIKTQNCEGVMIQARFYNTRTGGTLLGQDNFEPVSGDTDWTYYSAEIEVPGNTNYFDIVANNDPPISGDSYAWFDNTGLIEWEEWEVKTPSPDMVINPNDYYYLQIRTDALPLNSSVQFTHTAYEENPVTIHENEIPKYINAFLNSNYPNPFNPQTTISFTIKDVEGKTNIAIYNIKGQKVKTIIDEVLPVGDHSLIWDGTNSKGRNVSTGIYFYKMEFNGKHINTKKCLLLK